MNWSELLKENKILNGIKGFEGKYDCFSNFCMHDTIFIKLPYGKKDAKSYGSDNVETLFQAAKCTNHKDIQSIILTATPSEAKKLGRKVELRKDWEYIKEEVMRELLNKKFDFFPEFKNLLADIPDDIVIAEFNTWNDKEWGVSSKTLEGKNKLGKILMELRNKAKLDKHYESLKFIFKREIEKIMFNYADDLIEMQCKLTNENLDKLFEFYYYEVDPLEFNIFDNKELIKFIQKYIGDLECLKK